MAHERISVMSPPSKSIILFFFNLCILIFFLDFYDKLACLMLLADSFTLPSNQHLVNSPLILCRYPCPGHPASEPEKGQLQHPHLSDRFWKTSSDQHHRTEITSVYLQEIQNGLQCN